MLTVHQLSKSYNLKTLFTGVTFSVNPGDRIGLIGPNGCGKTTLMRIIAAVERPSSGSITHSTGLRLGYLTQGFELDDQTTLGAVIQRAAGGFEALEDELLQLAQALVCQPDDHLLQQRYDAVLSRISYANEGEALQIMASLDLDTLDPDMPVTLLSGGQKTRLALALTLVNKPELLLLDEPTNHLDIEMLQWLEEWLAGFAGGVLLVSHDRVFLDNTCNKILFMDPQTQKVREYAGSYSDYLAQWQIERVAQMAAYEDQVSEINRIKRDIARTRETARASEYASISSRKGGGLMRQKGFKDYVRSSAKGVAKQAKARESKLERYLDSSERVEKPQHSWQMRLDMSAAEHLGRAVLRLEDFWAGYDTAVPLVQIERLFVQSGQRIVLTGPNGVGKTTLLRTIAGHIPPLRGEVWLGPSVQLGYMSQEQELLDPHLSPVETLRHAGGGPDTEIRSFLHYFLFEDDEPLKPNRLLSYGQRARLELALLVTQGCNFLLLDEPINHLDIPSREMFEQALVQFEGATLSVVHDRMFIERFATEIWWLEDGKISREWR